MALPKINSAPKYTMTIPSTGKEVGFRPFLVKEEKILMMAMETGDQSGTLNAILETLKSCISGEVDEKKLAAYDVEYMFLQLRSKSVGETSTVALPCSNCKETTPVKIQLDTIEVKKDDTVDEVVKLTDNISVKMKYPSFHDLLGAGIDPEKMNEVDTIFKILTRCIDGVMTDDEFHPAQDETEEELQEFLESLNSEQFSNVRKFVEAIPQLKTNIEFKCEHCGTENNQEISGIANFF